MRQDGARNELKTCVVTALLAVLVTTVATALAASDATRRVTGRRVHRGTELVVESAPGKIRWTRQPAYPLAPGVAGAIAGSHRGVLIAAGGANFPDKMPWDGGAKIYYDDIFVLVPGEASWRAAGRLPMRRAYAAVVSTPEGVLAIGGENAEGISADVLRLAWDGRGVQISKAPSLPSARTGAAAVVLDDKVYVAGGYAPGAANVRTSAGDFWCLDLTPPRATWQGLPTWPGPPRAQAVIAAMEGAVYLLSGLNMNTDSTGQPRSTYLTDAYRYRANAWERLPDLPWSTVAAPSPAPVTMQPARVFVFGGVDGRLVGKVPRDTRVPGDIVVFDVASRQWRLWSEAWPDPVVTAPAVPFAAEWWIVSGEIMAGVRTTSVWSWKLETQ